MNNGLMLTISAPSGTGKSTLIGMLIKEYPLFRFSVSCTTRPRRPGEINGEDYYFIDREEFIRLRNKDHFAEWAEVHGNFYGTPRQKVLEALQSGQDLIFDIDVQGAVQLKNSLNMGLFVFIFPPSLKALENRLNARGTENPETILNRIKNAKNEIARSPVFDYWIINDNLQSAYDDLKSIVRAEKLRPFRQPDLPETIIGDIENS